VLVVPALCRLLLRSSRWPLGRGLVAAVVAVFGGAVACLLIWQLWVEGVSPFSQGASTLLAGVRVGWIAFMLSRGPLRPMEENPTSRLILWVYEPTLRLFLAHKFSFVMIPLMIVVIGAGAWFGLPTILAPAERVARSLGTEPNSLPGYVDLKHRLPGLR